ncbi:MAG: hypothetical protein FWE83_01115 [Oscillospiraceae bacterium]|nr:hypothetical protein [Oscillospiraceae bacterium]
MIDEINEGTFVSRRPGTPSSSGADHDSTNSGNMQPWESAFNKMTEEFRSVLRGYADTEDAEAVKPALRQYIEMLEDLYKNL